MPRKKRQERKPRIGDVVLVKWKDAATSVGWADKPSGLLGITTVGFYGGIERGSHGRFLIITPSVDDGGKIADTLCIPIEGVLDVSSILEKED